MKEDNVLKSFILKFIEKRKNSMGMKDEVYVMLCQKADIVYDYFIYDVKDSHALSLLERMLAAEIHDEMFIEGHEELYIKYRNSLWIPCYGTELITESEIKECISLGLEFDYYSPVYDFEYECYWNSQDEFYEWTSKGKQKQFYWITRS